jgi:hypothetical protein
VINARTRDGAECPHQIHALPGLQFAGARGGNGAITHFGRSKLRDINLYSALKHTPQPANILGIAIGDEPYNKPARVSYSVTSVI